MIGQTFDFFEALFGTTANELGMASEVWAFIGFIIVAGFFGSLFACLLNLFALLFNPGHRETSLSSVVKTGLLIGIFYIISFILSIPLYPFFFY